MIYVVELKGKKYRVEVDDSKVTLLGLAEDDPNTTSLSTDLKSQDTLEPESDTCLYVRAPMYGVIMRVEKNKGATVKKGDVLFILEAMKMENEIIAPENGTIKNILVSPGENVQKNATMAVIEKR
jgi:glutaconyl-CoA/methylmalonyl-CoA decarboxylase subunit gamma